MIKKLPSYRDDISELEPFACVRLIALDLDGTLVPAELSYRIQHQIRSLRLQDVVVTIATGRTLTGAQPLVQKISLPTRTPIILYNGSVVMETNTNRILHQRRIPSSSLHAICEAAGSHAIAVLAYFLSDPVRDLAEIGGSLEHVVGWSKDRRASQKMRADFNKMLIRWQPQPFSTDGPAPSAILLPIFTQNDPEAVDEVAATIDALPGVDVTRSGDSFLEVRPQGSNKGAAILAVGQYLGVAAQDSMAVGDNDNDAEMLLTAGIGVAIAGASAHAIACSDFVARHGTFSGVVEAMEVVRKAKRYFGDGKNKRMTK